MIDLNCHALGEDELAAGLEGSRELCARARIEGVEEMIITLRLAGTAEMISERQRRFAEQLKLLRAEVGDRIRLGSGYEWTIGPELPALLGRSTKELAKALGPAYEREVIHRDDLVII